MKNKNGFTILELLATLGIIIVLLAATLPLASQLGPTVALNSEIRQIIVDLRWAQQLSIAEQIAHEVRFDSVNSEYRVYKVGEAEELLKEVELSEGMVFSEINLVDNKVSFDSLGGASQTGSVTLGNANDQEVQINIKSSGLVNLAD